MVAAFRLRDWLRPRREVLQEVGIRPGFRVLDFGCGTGSYILESAGLVGEAGQVIALDVNPLAVEAAKQLAARRGLRNVRTVLSDCATGLPDESMDVVLLYDILHDLSAGSDVLQEVHRVLKPGGILSVSDHHLRGREIVTRVTSAHLFRVAAEGMLTYSFTPQEIDGPVCRSHSVRPVMRNTG
jgi:ubiquinone/menaquinone biosynthesis C-methylase UbiE